MSDMIEKLRQKRKEFMRRCEEKRIQAQANELERRPRKSSDRLDQQASGSGKKKPAIKRSTESNRISGRMMARLDEIRELNEESRQISDKVSSSNFKLPTIEKEK